MKTFHLNETDLEWSLKHLLRFYSSEFFPKEFEFEAIKGDWPRIKEHLIGLDIAAYVPKTPLTRLAPKANGTFRAVHQLDPLDATPVIRHIEVREGSSRQNLKIA